MNKIKIIDLLNMISKGEEVPERIKYNGEEFQFTGYDSASKNYINGLEDLFEILDGSMLNNEVEIIEPQEHKIPEKIKIDNEDRIQALSTGNFVYKVNQPTKNIIYKINEILDYLKSKGE